MGRQEGLIKIKGQMGGISFYKGKDGYLARQKGAGLTAERIKNDPSLQRIRENGQEFGTAGKSGKVLRSALRTLLINTADSRMTSRLTKQLMRVIQADINNIRGQRKVMSNTVSMLTGFDFNADATLGSVLLAPYATHIDRAAGTASLALSSFIPKNMLRAPQGATHFRIISAGCEIDFDNGTFITDMKNSVEWELLPTAIHIDPLISTVTPQSTKPLFLAVGIEFFQQVNGELYPLKNSGHNALSLVKIDGGI